MCSELSLSVSSPRRSFKAWTQRLSRGSLKIAPCIDTPEQEKEVFSSNLDVKRSQTDLKLFLNNNSTKPPVSKHLSSKLLKFVTHRPVSRFNSFQTRPQLNKRLIFTDCLSKRKMSHSPIRCKVLLAVSSKNEYTCKESDDEDDEENEEEEEEDDDDDDDDNDDHSIINIKSLSSNQLIKNRVCQLSLIKLNGPHRPLCQLLLIHVTLKTSSDESYYSNSSVQNSGQPIHVNSLSSTRQRVSRVEFLPQANTTSQVNFLSEFSLDVISRRVKQFAREKQEKTSDVSIESGYFSISKNNHDNDDEDFIPLALLHRTSCSSRSPQQHIQAQQNSHQLFIGKRVDRLQKRFLSLLSLHIIS